MNVAKTKRDGFRGKRWWVKDRIPLPSTTQFHLLPTIFYHFILATRLPMSTGSPTAVESKPVASAIGSVFWID